MKNNKCKFKWVTEYMEEFNDTFFLTFVILTITTIDETGNF